MTNHNLPPQPDPYDAVQAFFPAPPPAAPPASRPLTAQEISHISQGLDLHGVPLGQPHEQTAHSQQNTPHTAIANALTALALQQFGPNTMYRHHGGQTQPFALPPGSHSHNPQYPYDTGQLGWAGRWASPPYGQKAPWLDRLTLRQKKRIAWAGLAVTALSGLALTKGYTPAYIAGRAAAIAGGNTTIPAIGMAANCSNRPVALVRLENRASMLLRMNLYTETDMARKKTSPTYKSTPVSGYPLWQTQVLPAKYFAKANEMPPSPWVEGTPNTIKRYPIIQYSAKQLAILACPINDRTSGNPITPGAGSATVDRSKILLSVNNNKPQDATNVMSGYERYPLQVQKGKEAESPFPPGELLRQTKVLSPNATKAATVAGSLNPAIINKFKTETMNVLNAGGECGDALTKIIDDSIRATLTAQASAQLGGKGYDVTFTGLYKPINDNQLKTVPAAQRTTQDVKFLSDDGVTMTICEPKAPGK